MRVLTTSTLFAISAVAQTLLSSPIEDALALFRSGDPGAAIGVLRSFIGSDGFRTASPGERLRAYASLGSLAHERGDFLQSESAYRQASRICDAENLGIECSLEMANNLATIYLEFGELEKAETQLKRFARLDLTPLGPTHTQVLRWLGNQGGLDLANNRPKQAIAWCSQALNGWIDRKEPASIDAMIARSNLGLALIAGGQYPQAVAVLEQCLRDVESSAAQPLSAKDDVALATGPASVSRVQIESRIPVALANLARAKSLNGESAQALALSLRAVEDATRRLGESHPVTGVVLLYRAECLEKSQTGKSGKKESRRIRQQARSILDAHRRNAGLDHSVDAASLRKRR